MDGLVFLVPIAIALGALFAGLFLVAARNGEFDDLDEDSRRVLEED
jgi:cbb3-type cytochrome oxidase maturation protein